MSGIQPQSLSTEELMRYVWLAQYKVDPEWVKELVLRLEKSLDDLK